eukprot:5124198-Amphidinium_carterae.1
MDVQTSVWLRSSSRATSVQQHALAMKVARVVRKACPSCQSAVHLKRLRLAALQNPTILVNLTLTPLLFFTTHRKPSKKSLSCFGIAPPTQLVIALLFAVTHSCCPWETTHSQSEIISFMLVCWKASLGALCKPCFRLQSSLRGLSATV